MPPSEPRRIETALYFERTAGTGNAIAALAWEGDEWTVVPSLYAPPSALASLLEALDSPIGKSLRDLQRAGRLSASVTFRANSVTEAARLALEAAGLYL